ncbi:MAG: hypothetical protein KDD43_07020 [Bdellovibrionales bacterium]|nr:hypothetical protein [Bdellovibrionales bacterium]
MAPIARADLSHKSQGQLSFVSNANYESQGEDSDWILSAEHRSSGDFSIGQMSLSGRLSKYLSEDQNDSFSWRGSYSRQQGTQDKDWTLWAGLFGTHYLEGAPATTESTFDHVGMDVGAELFRTLGRAEIAFGPYYQFKSFSSFSGRKDHTLAGYGEIMYAPKQWKLIPGAEIGFTNSSLSEYSKVFLSISFRAEARFRGPWSFEGEYLIRSTHFTSRTITQTTAISRGRGQVVFGTVETKEGHQYRELELAAVRQLFESWKFSSGIRSLSQSSKSGIEDYTSLEMFVQMSSSY